MRIRSLLVYFLVPVFLIMAFSTAVAEEVDFSVSSDDGVITSDSLRGKLVYIDFWASWCVPCRKSFPWMNAMQAKYKNRNFIVLAINLDKDRALADKFLSKFPADFQIAYDPKGELAEQFNVVGMPMAFMMDESGQIVDKHVGFKSSKVAEYEDSIVKLLESSQ